MYIHSHTHLFVCRGYTYKDTHASAVHADRWTHFRDTSTNTDTRQQTGIHGGRQTDRVREKAVKTGAKRPVTQNAHTQRNAHTLRTQIHREMEVCVLVLALQSTHQCAWTPSFSRCAPPIHTYACMSIYMVWYLYAHACVYRHQCVSYMNSYMNVCKRGQVSVCECVCFLWGRELLSPCVSTHVKVPLPSVSPFMCVFLSL